MNILNSLPATEVTECIGRGCFAKVYALGESEVLKEIRKKDPAYKVFLRAAKVNKGNPHLPVITRFIGSSVGRPTVTQRILGEELEFNNFIGYRMKRLRNIDSIECTEGFHLADTIRSFVSSLTGFHRGHEAFGFLRNTDYIKSKELSSVEQQYLYLKTFVSLRQVTEDISELHRDGLDALVLSEKYLKEYLGIDVTEVIPELCEAMHNLCKAAKGSPMAFWDLHDNNFMYDPDTKSLVLTDTFDTSYD